MLQYLDPCLTPFLYPFWSLTSRPRHWNVFLELLVEPQNAKQKWFSEHLTLPWASQHHYDLEPQLEIAALIPTKVVWRMFFISKLVLKKKHIWLDWCAQFLTFGGGKDKKVSKTVTSWGFQPIWIILVKIQNESFPQVGVKIWWK